MRKVSVTSFRVLVPATTPAISPVSVTVNPISSGLIHLSMFVIAEAAALESFGTFGWRAKNNGVPLIPDNGSKDAGFTVNAQSEAWGGLPKSGSNIELDLFGMELNGPPYNLTFEFYNSSATFREVAGLVVSAEPAFDIHDLVKELARQRERAEVEVKNARLNLNTSEYIKN